MISYSVMRMKFLKNYDEMNEFRTSVRGLKVRGVYDSRREAEVRAKTIQKKINH